MRPGRMATQWMTVVVLLLILAAINRFWPDLTGFDFGPTQAGNAYVAIDGDSFRAGKTEVRLHGIDAPEYRQSCTDAIGSEKPCGKMARDQLSTLLRGRTVSCKVLERDRYGRQVSICRDGELEINREMVRLGWAMAYRKHAGAYIAAENEARKAKRGIWQWRFEKPEEHRKRLRTVAGSLAGED